MLPALATGDGARAKNKEVWLLNWYGSTECGTLHLNRTRNRIDNEWYDGFQVPTTGCLCVVSKFSLKNLVTKGTVRVLLQGSSPRRVLYLEAYSLTQLSRCLGGERAREKIFSLVFVTSSRRRRSFRGGWWCPVFEDVRKLSALHHVVLAQLHQPRPGRIDSWNLDDL